MNQKTALSMEIFNVCICGRVFIDTFLRFVFHFVMYYYCCNLRRWFVYSTFHVCKIGNEEEITCSSSYNAKVQSICRLMLHIRISLERMRKNVNTCENINDKIQAISDK